MKTQPTEDHPEIINRPAQDLNLFFNLLTNATHWAHKHKGAPDDITNAQAQTDILKAFLTSDITIWKIKFQSSQHTAALFYRNPDDYWKTIALGVSPPELQKEVTNIPPPIDREKYSPHHEQRKPSPANVPGIGTGLNTKKSISLTRAWRLDPRYEKLIPCAKTLLPRLIFRSYRKDTIQKIKQALSKGERQFPWCLTGMKSLEKQLTHHHGRSTKTKNYERRQIGRALKQLCRLGFIYREFRGYPKQGVGKYYILSNPKMSAAFHRPSPKTK